MTAALQDMPQAAPPGAEHSELPRVLLEAVTSAADCDAARLAIGEILVQRGLARAVRWISRELDGRLGDRVAPHDGTVELPAAATALAGEACCRGEPRLARLNPLLVAAPVFRRGAVPDAVVVVCGAMTAERAQQLAVLAATHATLADLWHDVQDVGHTVRATAAILELLEGMERADGMAAACGELADRLLRHFGCQRVAVGLYRGGRCRLQSLGSSETFDRRSEVTHALEAALDEALLRRTLSVFPPTDAAQRHSLRAHQRAAGLASVGCVVTLPLINGRGEPVGGCLLLGDSDPLTSPRCLRFLETLAPQAAQSLDLIRAAHRTGTWRRWKERCSRQSAIWLVCAALILSGVLCIPMPYRVRCDCELQPVTRRFIAAPFDAKLAQALVGPGDVVAPGDLLARVDGQEIRWELDAVLVDYDRASKKHAAALAKQNVAESQLARLEMDRLQLRRQLLEHRIANLEIRSPIAGIVLSGDLQRTEGAPLTLGQSLFEIAPLDEMVGEVAVPQSEVAYVAQGDHTSILLDACASRRWAAAVGKLHPRAELRNNESVFVAEVRLANQDGLLRPGMKGRAMIDVGRFPLAWNLLHQPWEALVRIYHGW
jgi:hypothetical protein